MTVEPPRLSGSLSGNSSVLVAAVLAALVVAWAATNLVLGGEGFAVLVSDKVVGGEEAASALARLFAALVLGLFLADAVGWRARWVAGGLVVLGLGHFVFGYLEPLIQEDPPELNESLYEAFVTQTLACALFMVGLFPGRPSRLVVWAATVIPVALVASYVVLFEFLHGEEWMPLLSRVANPEKNGDARLAPGLANPVALGTLGAAAGACGGGRSRGLLAESPGAFAELVALCGGAPRRVGLARLPWPSAYGGGLLPPRTRSAWSSRWWSRSAAFRSFGASPRSAQALLATERERARRLNELNALRSDFSAMIAHELETPIASVRKLNEMLSAEGEDPGVRGATPRRRQRGELDALTNLVRDVRAVAAVEREDFEVEARPLPLEKLLADAEAYASTLPGQHPIEVMIRGDLGTGGLRARRPRAYRTGLAQPALERRQVLARGHAHRAKGVGKEGRVRIEIADRGPGIHPEDVARIFEKFGRGRDRKSHKMPGAGLGLYLSQRIVRSHGSELTVQTRLGEGSVFGFELAVV